MTQEERIELEKIVQNMQQKVGTESKYEAQELDMPVVLKLPKARRILKALTQLLNDNSKENNTKI